MSKVTHLLCDKSSNPESCCTFLNMSPWSLSMFCALNIEYSMFHPILLELLNFPLEVIGANFCRHNFKLLFIFFFSQKEALERARLQERPSQPRSSSEEDSPDSPKSSLVRMTLSGKLLINLHITGGGVLPLAPCRPHFHRKAREGLIQYSL